jgi:hypothetical protein
LLLTIAVVVCLLAWKVSGILHDQVHSIAELQERTKYKFPRSAVLLNGEYSLISVAAKLRIAKQEVELFLKENEFAVYDPKIRGVVDSNWPSEWWRPDSAKSFVSAGSTFSYPDRTAYCFVLISLDDADNPVIYFLWGP